MPTSTPCRTCSQVKETQLSILCVLEKGFSSFLTRTAQAANLASEQLEAKCFQSYHYHCLCQMYPEPVLHLLLPNDPQGREVELGTFNGNSTAEPAHLWFASIWLKASTCNSPCSARHCSNCPAGKAWIWARRQPPKAAHNIASSRASRWRTSPLWETDGCCAGEHSWALDCLHQAARCLVVCGLY